MLAASGERLTGLAALDEAVSEFLVRGWEDEGGVSVEQGWLSNEEWEGGTHVPFSVFAAPQAAAGFCHSLNGQAARFLAARGFDAYSSEDDLPEGLEYDLERYRGRRARPSRPLHPDQLGYHDRTLPGLENHVVCFVETDEDVFCLDFACAQYGYRELPLVQRYQSGSFSRL